MIMNSKGMKKVFASAIVASLLILIYYAIRLPIGGKQEGLGSERNIQEHDETHPQAPLRYVHPHDQSIKGIEFKMNTHFHSLAIQLMNELKNGKTLDTLTMDSLVEAMTPVTAVSSNHFQELFKHVESFHQFFPNKALIVYDLGLTKNEVNTLKKISYVEYRNVDFSAYPEHVRNLKSYAFKPLIIQRVLAERGGVLWMDSSVKIKKPFTKALEQMVNNTSGFLYYLFSNSHSIRAVTHRKMFEYFPMRNYNANEKQPQASGFIVFNTPEIRKYIFKWAIPCSLVPECIIPKGSTMFCSFDASGKQTNPGCHRYDQSMFSILLTNQYSPDTKKYLINTELINAGMDRLSLTFYQKVLIFLKSWF